MMFAAKQGNVENQFNHPLTKSPFEYRFQETGNEVHVWKASLREENYSPSYIQEIQKYLSKEECNRSTKFIFEQDRHNYLLCRGILRKLLGKYTQKPPEELIFSTNNCGKPFLLFQTSEKKCQFNYSHSGKIAVFAFSATCNPGIDVEQFREIPEIDNIIQNYFSKDEQKALVALPDEKKLAGFFNIWTQKEACIKALGTGLNFPLNVFSVPFLMENSACYMPDENTPGIFIKQELHTFSPAPDYFGALAVQGNPDIKYFDYAWSD